MYLSQRKNIAQDAKKSYKALYHSEIKDYEEEAKKLEQQEADLIKKLE